MQAIYVDSSTADASAPYSVENPAPSSALKLGANVPVPQLKDSDDIRVQIKAASIVRDCLTWPETYSEPNGIPGNDFAGVVTAINDESKSKFKVGDEVYGMSHADRSRTWAEYAVVKEDETAPKPSHLSFSEAAVVPLSALTAYQALFTQAKLPDYDFDASANKEKKQVLVTGASGAVGVYLIQIAALAGYHVVAASSSNARNKDTLTALGAAEAVEYSEIFGSGRTFEVIIDTTGGDNLTKSWALATDPGYLITIDSGSFEFVDEAKKNNVPGADRAGVNAFIFVVEPSQEHLVKIGKLLDSDKVKFSSPVEYGIQDPIKAYDACHVRSSAPGKGKAVFVF